MMMCDSMEAVLEEYRKRRKPVVHPPAFHSKGRRALSRNESLNPSGHETPAKANHPCRSKGVSVLVVDALICALGTIRTWPMFTAHPGF
jgi:hypothetical protein